MNYQEFLEKKKKTFVESGFDIDESKLNTSLKDFQKYGVKVALRKGKFAFFFDCGLGKTFCQLEWAKHVSDETGGKVLILAPLAIVEQTKLEAEKFGIDIDVFDITNYEQIRNIETASYSGVVLDESSILKGRDGKTSKLILDTFSKTPYKLACTATPSPNDHMELGQHSEFLGGMTYQEMLAMFFVHDGGETSKWRLRKHAQDDFWNYVATWSMAIDNPATLGFSGDGYSLPPINYIEHLIKVDSDGLSLFNDVAVSATDLHKDLRKSINDRVELTAKMVNESNEQWIVWALSNAETDLITKLIPDAINVQGSDSPEYKAKHLNGFAKGDFRVLVTKTSIASMGMNYQSCHNMVFLSYDFKFEQFYQAVRRCYRFGQKHPVNVHLMVPETQANVRTSILEKQDQHFERIREMAKYSSEQDYKTNKSRFAVKQEEIKTDKYWLMNGDCVEKTMLIPDNTADIIVYSPPFFEMYVYSDDPKDMNNCDSYDTFMQHYRFLLKELKRVLKPGRICAVHTMDLPIQKGKDGFIGLRDFSGDLIKMHQDAGFIYHARTTIWKNPVTEMQRTKALGLLHKTIKKDSSMSRVGIPDYVLFFRNEGENETPITHQDTDPTMPDYLPVDLWQKYASPVWMDVDYSRTLQYRSARDNNDEKHITPLQLDTIERILHLYSNEGETVFSPFGGIGSEGFQAIKMGRKSISIELKESYFSVNEKNHRDAVMEEETVLTLF